MFEIGVENSLNFLSEEFRELFASSRATAFQHPLWLDRLYGRLAPRFDAEPLVIVVRWRGSGRLAMVLPMIRRRHGVMRVVEFADFKVSDYAAPVCDRATFGLILRDDLACERIRRALRPYDVLRVQKVRDDAMPLDRLFGRVTRTGMGMNAHAVALYGPFEQWRADNIDPSYRKELDKKGRQIRRKGEVRFGPSLDPGEITATFHRMRDYRRPRFQDRDAPDLLQGNGYFDFYLDLAITGARLDVCRTYTLWMDRRPISGVFGLTHQGQFLTVLGGFDLAGFKNYSIGALVFEAVAGDCIARGERLLDFTIGDESYKRLFGMKPTPMWTLSAAGSPVGSLIGFVSGQMPWTMKIAKRMVAGKALV
jgi:CelD/BcsL family acetyltransferase involved in cellulose biosynthesis